MLTTSLKFAEKYNYLEEKFHKAYEFLRTADLKNLPLGRVDIDGDFIFANVQEYDSVDPATAKFEAHNVYFDIQYVVEGKEMFGYVAREGLTEDAPYNEKDDIVFFKEPEHAGFVFLGEGDCIVVAPEDAHKPRCMAKTSEKVRKIVIKVRV